MCSNDTVRILHNPKHRLEYAGFQNLQKQLERYLDESEYEIGLRVSLDAVKRFPEKPALTHLWALDFLLSLGKKEEAIKVLKHGFHHGAWWSPKLLITGFQELEDHPDFPRIIELARERFNEEKVNAKAELVVRTPREYSGEKDYPLLLVLHGAFSNNDNSQHTWTSILEKKPILLALLQSSQIMSSDHFVWDDEDIALRDVKNALSVLVRNYRIDNSKIILGGVSHGAEIALVALFSGSTPANGFISVIPSVGAFMKQFVKKDALLRWKGNARGFIIAGEKDPRYRNTQIVYEFLTKQGINCQFCSVLNSGHTIPNDFDLVLERAINFVLTE